MYIKILTTFSHNGLFYYQDEIRKVSDQDGASFCTNGWAKDITGNIETEQANIQEVILNVANLTQPQVTEINNG